MAINGTVIYQDNKRISRFYMTTFSIIQKSQLEGAMRMDSDYFQPEFLDIENKLSNIKTQTIADISESVVNFGAYSLCNYIKWEDSGVPYLNVQDIKEGYIDFDNTKFISEKVNEILKKSKVTEGQIIMTMAGTIGNVAVAHKIPEKVNSNQATAKITLKKNISPYYIAAFFNSYYGRNQIIREIVSSVQPNIFLFQIKNFKVPVASEVVQKEIGNVYIKGLNESENSRNYYKQAENLLLEELGLKGFDNEEKLSSIVNFSEIESVRRIDAEYFQPKYKIIEDRVKKYNVHKLGDLVLLKKGIEVGAEEYQEEGKVFIRVSSMTKFGIIESDQKYLSDKLYESLKKDFEPKKGEILLTKDATPGIAYVLKEDIQGIISGGTLRLKLKNTEIESEYLALCLNSIIGQMQAERDAGGSVIAHWKPEQIKNVSIPILPKETQQKIADLAQKSHEARKKAKELLEEAKRKVEDMIEKG